jgi:hypothetical protein
VLRAWGSGFAIVGGPMDGTLHSIPTLTLSGLDADNLATAVKVGAGAVLNIFYTVTVPVTSPEAVTNLHVADVTLEGPDVTGLTWYVETTDEYGNPAIVTLDINSDGYFTVGGELLVLEPGERFAGRATLTNLPDDPNMPHANRATVWGEGVVTRLPVGDEDEFWAIDPPLISTIAVAVAPDADSDDWRTVRGSQNEAVGIKGDYLRDRLLVWGPIPDGSTVEVDLFFNAPGEPLDDSNLVTTLGPIQVSAPADGQAYREYITEPWGPTDRVGVWHFRERLYSPDGDLLSQAEIGVPSETVYVVQPTTTAGWEDRNGDGVPNVGDWFFDDIHVAGELPAGVGVSMSATAYRVPHEGVVWPEDVRINAGTGHIPGIGLTDGSREISELLYTLPVQASWSGAGTYRTDGFTLTQNDAFGLGALTWMEHFVVTNPGQDGSNLDNLPDDHIRVDGAWGVIEETIAPVNHSAGEILGAGGVGGRAPGLARTGATLLPWIVGGLGLALTLGAVKLHRGAVKVRINADSFKS